MKNPLPKLQVSPPHRMPSGGFACPLVGETQWLVTVYGDTGEETTRRAEHVARCLDRHGPMAEALQAGAQAAQAVFAAWDSGDLAAAVNALGRWRVQALEGVSIRKDLA